VSNKKNIILLETPSERIDHKDHQLHRYALIQSKTRRTTILAMLTRNSKKLMMGKTEQIAQFQHLGEEKARLAKSHASANVELTACWVRRVAHLAMRSSDDMTRRRGVAELLSCSRHGLRS